MKLGLVTKLGKRNMATSKKIADDVMSTNYDSLSFLQYMTNLEQSGSQIRNAWSLVPTFLLIVTFYLTKTENRTKKSLT